MPKNTDQPAGVVCLIRSLTAALKAKVTAEHKPIEQQRVACFSMGSWGTGVARQVGQSLLHLKRFEETLPVWVPSEETKKAINETGFDERHLPGLRLPRNIRATLDPVEVGPMQWADVVGTTCYILPRSLYTKVEICWKYERMK